MVHKYDVATMAAVLDNIRPFSVGFDRVFSNIGDVVTTGTTNYPPYNILKESEEDYVIQLAVAGFAKDSFKVEVVPEGRKLVITGEQSSEDEAEYLHKGIGARSFTRTFVLAEDVEVKSANYEDGILEIRIRKVVPEEKKPTVIPVG